VHEQALESQIEHNATFFAQELTSLKLKLMAAGIRTDSES
jgi:hypothetical protein